MIVEATKSYSLVVPAKLSITPKAALESPLALIGGGKGGGKGGVGQLPEG